MLPPYLIHLKPDMLGELNTGHLYQDNSPVATKKLPWGMLSGKEEGEGGKGQAVSPSPYCSKPVLICITLCGLSLFCHSVDCHQISSDMMHGRFMHREADTAGVWCVCVSFPVNNTQGAVTLTRFIMIDLFGRIETFTSIEQKPHQTGNLYLNRCLSQRVEPCFCLAAQGMNCPKHMAQLRSGQSAGSLDHQNLTLMKQNPFKHVFQKKNLPGIIQHVHVFTFKQAVMILENENIVSEQKEFSAPCLIPHVLTRVIKPTVRGSYKESMGKSWVC